MTLQAPLRISTRWTEHDLPQRTICSEFMDRTKALHQLSLTPQQKAHLLFERFMDFVREQGWTYTTGEAPSDILRFSLDDKVEINCFGLIETLRAFFKAHGFEDAEVHRYYPCFGHSIALKVPGKAHSGIFGRYECFDQKYQQECLRAGRVLVNRHAVVKVLGGTLFFDPTFNCSFVDPQAIIACSDCIESQK